MNLQHGCFPDVCSSNSLSEHNIGTQCRAIASNTETAKQLRTQNTQNTQNSKVAQQLEPNNQTAEQSQKQFVWFWVHCAKIVEHIRGSKPSHLICIV